MVKSKIKKEYALYGLIRGVEYDIDMYYSSIITIVNHNKPSIQFDKLKTEVKYGIFVMTTINFTQHVGTLFNIIVL